MSESTDFQSGTGQPDWQPGRHPDTAAPSGQSLIGPTVVIRGEVSAEEDLLVMGRVEGFIDHSQTVTIHANGTVAAEVKAQEVLVEGTVDGNVYGTRRVQIAETGKVNGNVYAPRVGVVEGASFKGAIDMNSDVEDIERRFHEQTGTEIKKSSTTKSSPKQASAGKDGEKDNAAQVDGKGSSDETGTTATDGSDD